MNLAQANDYYIDRGYMPAFTVDMNGLCSSILKKDGKVYKGTGSDWRGAAENARGAGPYVTPTEAQIKEVAGEFV